MSTTIGDNEWLQGINHYNWWATEIRFVVSYFSCDVMFIITWRLYMYIIMRCHDSIPESYYMLHGSSHKKIPNWLTTSRILIWESRQPSRKRYSSLQYEYSSYSIANVWIKGFRNLVSMQSRHFCSHTKLVQKISNLGRLQKKLELFVVDCRIVA